MKTPQIWDPYKDFQKTVLPNGLTIYSAYWDRPWIHMRFCVHSGSLQDPKEKAGLAHLVEHMISCRFGKLSLKKFSHCIKKTGGSANLGATKTSNTSFSLEQPINARAISNCVENFAKMLLQPLDKRLFEKERKIVLQEYRKDFPTSESYAMEITPYKDAFCGTSLDGFQTTIGSIESIRAIEMLDVEKFFAQHYVPSNISIVAAGGIVHEEFVEIIKRSLFSMERPGQRNSIKTPLAEVAYPSVNEESCIFSKLFPGIKIDVGGLFGYVMIPGIFSRESVVVFRCGLREILFEEIRQKFGSTYAPEVTWDYFGDVYSMRVTLYLEKEELEKIQVSNMRDFLLAIRDRKVFDRHKQYSVKDFMIDDINVEEFCEKAEDMLVGLGDIISSKERMQRYEDLTFEEYCSLLDYLADEKRWWILKQIP